MSIRVLIAERDEIYRADLASFLALADIPCTIIGTVGTADEALLSAASLAPDVTLADVELPDMGGLALTQRLLELRPAPAVVVIGQHHDGAYEQAALDAGAMAYVAKVELGRVLADVIVAVFRDRRRADVGSEPAERPPAPAA